MVDYSHLSWHNTIPAVMLIDFSFHLCPRDSVFSPIQTNFFHFSSCDSRYFFFIFLGLNHSYVCMSLFVMSSSFLQFLGLFIKFLVLVCFLWHDFSTQLWRLLTWFPIIFMFYQAFVGVAWLSHKCCSLLSIADKS